MYYSGVVLSITLTPSVWISTCANVVSMKQAFVAHFCCPWGTLLSTVLVIHIDPVTSIPVSCWRQYCSCILTFRPWAIRRDGVETVGVHIGDLWKNLEALSGRWEKQQAAIFHLRGPLDGNKKSCQSIQEPSEAVRDTWREKSSIITFSLGSVEHQQVSKRNCIT